MNRAILLYSFTSITRLTLWSTAAFRWANSLNSEKTYLLGELILEDVQDWIASKEIQFFYHRMSLLPERWQKVIDSDRYFKGGVRVFTRKKTTFLWIFFRNSNEVNLLKPFVHYCVLFQHSVIFFMQKYS